MRRCGANHARLAAWAAPSRPVTWSRAAGSSRSRRPGGRRPILESGSRQMKASACFAVKAQRPRGTPVWRTRKRSGEGSPGRRIRCRSVGRMDRNVNGADCGATRTMLIIPRKDAAGGRQPRRAAVLTTGGLALALLALLATACSGSGQGVQVTGNNGAAAGNQPKITITPANGAASADPSAGITVTAAAGKLTNVSVHTSGAAVAGTLSPDGKSWHSQWALEVSESYTVKATAAEQGGKP